MTDLFVVGAKLKRRQRPWWLPALIAGVLTLLPGGYLAYRGAQLHEFRAAPECEQVQTANCWYGAYAVVQWVHYSDSTNTTYVKVLADPPADKPIRFEESWPLPDEVDTGDVVFVEVWHGQVWNVRHGDTYEYTSVAVRYIVGAALLAAALVIIALALLIRPLWRSRSRYPIRVLYLAGMTWANSTSALFVLFAPITLIGTSPSTMWTVVWPLLSVGACLGLVVGCVGAVRVWRASRRPAIEPGSDAELAALHFDPRPMPIQRSLRRRRREELTRRYLRITFRVILVGGTITALAIYPHLDNLRDAYSRASMCSSAMPQYDCRYVVTDYVLKTQVTNGRDASQEIDLRFGRHIDLPSSGRSFVQSLQPADPVVVEWWHGKVVRAGYPAPTFTTDDNPGTNFTLDLRVALGGLILCLVMFAVIRRQRTGPLGASPRWWRIDGPLAILVVAAAVLLFAHRFSAVVVGGIALVAMVATAYAPRRWLVAATAPPVVQTDTVPPARI